MADILRTASSEGSIWSKVRGHTGLDLEQLVEMRNAQNAAPNVLRDFRVTKIFNVDDLISIIFLVKYFSILRNGRFLGGKPCGLSNKVLRL